MIHDNRLRVGKGLGPVFLLLGEFLALWQTKKTQCEFNKGFFGKKKCQSSYICLLFTILCPFGTRESIRRKVDHGGQIVLWDWQHEEKHMSHVPHI